MDPAETVPYLNFTPSPSEKHSVQPRSLQPASNYLRNVQKSPPGGKEQCLHRSMRGQPACLSRLHLRLLLVLTHTLTNVEEQGCPDRQSQSPQVVLGVGTPLEAHRRQVANHHSAHLREDMTTNRQGAFRYRRSMLLPQTVLFQNL